MVLVPTLAVGAAGTPVKVGPARSALRFNPVVTKAVVAICVVFVPAFAVGARGIPVKFGLAIGAFEARLEKLSSASDPELS